MNSKDREGTERIREAVRAAVRRLRGVERIAIEGYYFDGRSLPEIASCEGITFRRINLSHQRGLAQLRVDLADVVKEMYGIEVVVQEGCAICRAAWRADAEALLDAKTPEMTWGEMIVRLERAVGWRAPCPQTLIMHQRKHRDFAFTATQGDSDDAA